MEEEYTVTDVRDDLNNLEDLVDVCIAALHPTDMDVKPIKVANVLYFFVKKEISKAEENLKNV